jgi:dTDP-4-dehydrorhamnose reductase
MEKRIILTGSNGLLGQKIVNLLAGRDKVELVATSRGVNRHTMRQGYAYEDADITQEILWEELFSEYKPTELIHTAAMTQVDLCEDDRALCDQINVDSTRMLARLCKEYGTRMIHISTDFIFNGENGPYKETDKPDPVNYYGLSKLKAEEAILQSGVNSTILRTILLYGIVPGMSRSNIVLWAKSALSARKTIQIVNDQFRCPTLAEDLASAVVLATMRGANGIFHISGPEMMPVVDLVREVARFWSLDPDLITEVSSESLNQKAKRPPRTGFIILKAQTELGYRPHTLRQGLSIVDKQIKEISNFP